MKNQYTPSSMGGLQSDTDSLMQGMAESQSESSPLVPYRPPVLLRLSSQQAGGGSYMASIEGFPIHTTGTMILQGAAS